MKRIPGAGWLALLGGGEFSFGETADADEAWLAKAGPGTIGFVPAASGSTDYVRHFAMYLNEAHGREVEVIPIYRERDARRERNAERIAACAAIYLGGGVPDHLAEALAGSPALAALEGKLAEGGVVVAIAAAAQVCGARYRSIVGGRPSPGFDWLPGGAVETNFDPGHDRRLRALLKVEGVEWGLGVPFGGALLLSGDGGFEAVGPVFELPGADADFQVLGEEAAAVE